MSSLVDAAEEELPKSVETLAEVERRHKAEIRKLEGETRALLKTAKKSNRAQIEAQIIRMQYDLKSRHNEEIDALESSGGAAASAGECEVPDVEDDKKASEEELIAAKKAKAKKKQDKKKSKDNEKEELRQRIKDENSGPSSREIELEKINAKLAEERMQVKAIISDGNCLYRAIADQLQQLVPGATEDYNSLRGIASSYMRNHPDEFCPFLGLETGDPEFDAYCDKVASLTQAEWGGQLEIKALSAALQRPIMVYSANAPVMCMNDSSAAVGEVAPLRVTFHSHYYALGEHYNSAIPL